MKYKDQYYTDVDHTAFYQRLTARTFVGQMEKNRVIQLFDLLSNCTEPTCTKDLLAGKTLDPPMSVNCASHIFSLMQSRGLVKCIYKQHKGRLTPYWYLVSHALEEV